MRVIGIVGGGFTGTMTAVQLIHKSTQPCTIVIIHDSENLNRGIAFNPYSDKHVLNVIAGEMSAFPDQPGHFLEWVMRQDAFIHQDKNLVENSFLSRRLYGDYITSIWSEAKKIAATRQIEIRVINARVTDLTISNSSVDVQLNDASAIHFDYCVIATGNNIPGHPRIPNMEFYASPTYFQNPWTLDTVTHLHEGQPVLIIGNGLTMVDTVLGLTEQGFTGEIHSISPGGFQLLPHRHSGIKYSKLTEELTTPITLHHLIMLLHKHIRIAGKLGFSAEPIIDSLRPHSQQLWKSFSDKEKATFMAKLRHQWGIARHRIPGHIHDLLKQLMMEKKLIIHTGHIVDITESNGMVNVEYLDKKTNQIKTLKVSRVINCTGPETNLSRIEKSFLKNCLQKGIITQDKLHLGIVTDTNTFQIIDATGHPHPNLFTLGSNLKGELWETTAIYELSRQAEQLADNLAARLT